MPEPDTAPPLQSPAELLREQQTLMELASSGAFRWFVLTCIRKRRLEAEGAALDTEGSDVQTAKEKYLRAELLKMETWVEKRKESNQAALSSIDKDRKAQ
jgi:hypothetical protein